MWFWVLRSWQKWRFPKWRQLIAQSTWPDLELTERWNDWSFLRGEWVRLYCGRLNFEIFTIQVVGLLPPCLCPSIQFRFCDPPNQIPKNKSQKYYFALWYFSFLLNFQFSLQKTFTHGGLLLVWFLEESLMLQNGLGPSVVSMDFFLIGYFFCKNL